MNMDTDVGKALLFANFFLPLFFTTMVETALYRETVKYRTNVFVAAFLAAYALQAVTFIFTNTKSVGTSIIAISMLIFMVYWSAHCAWRFKQNSARLKISGLLALFLIGLNAILAVFFAVLIYIIYSAENSFGHALGGAIFIFLAICLHIDPDWSEHLQIQFEILKKKISRS